MDYGDARREAAILQLPVIAVNGCDGHHVKDHGTTIFVELRQFSLRNQRFRTVIAQKLRYESSLITAIFLVRSRLFSACHANMEI
jgi:hypothetical protein